MCSGESCGEIANRYSSYDAIRLYMEYLVKRMDCIPNVGQEGYLEGIGNSVSFKVFIKKGKKAFGILTCIHRIG